MIDLGSIVRDPITGAKGMVIGRAQYLFIDPHVLVQPHGMNAADAPQDTYWISESRMEVQHDAASIIKETNSKG